MQTSSLDQMTPAFNIQVLYKKLLIVLLWLLLPCATMAAEYAANPTNTNGAGDIYYSATKTQGLALDLPITVTGQRWMP
jgi:hypothetical protein